MKWARPAKEIRIKPSWKIRIQCYNKGVGVFILLDKHTSQGFIYIWKPKYTETRTKFPLKIWPSPASDVRLIARYLLMWFLSIIWVTTIPDLSRDKSSTRHFLLSLHSLTLSHFISPRLSFSSTIHFCIIFSLCIASSDPTTTTTTKISISFH